jgi:hypothetical protein
MPRDVCSMPPCPPSSQARRVRRAVWPRPRRGREAAVTWGRGRTGGGSVCPPRPAFTSQRGGRALGACHCYLIAPQTRRPSNYTRSPSIHNPEIDPVISREPSQHLSPLGPPPTGVLRLSFPPPPPPTTTTTTGLANGLTTSRANDTLSSATSTVPAAAARGDSQPVRLFVLCVCVNVCLHVLRVSWGRGGMGWWPSGGESIHQSRPVLGVCGYGDICGCVARRCCIASENLGDCIDSSTLVRFRRLARRCHAVLSSGG